MRVLVLGGGGREHALVWKFSQSRLVSGLFVAPGNAGTVDLAATVTDLSVDDPAEVLALCRKHRIDLVVVGPEGPLDRGIVDALAAAGVSAIGPGRKSALLESSKAFAKAFMDRHDIPTAAYREYKNYADFETGLAGLRNRIVLKKNGLAAGKGVLETDDPAAAAAFARAVLQSDSLVVEDFLEGFELSVFVLTDGLGYRVLPACMDHKKAFEGDRGPNTGGMGAVCPVPTLTRDLMNLIEREVVAPTIRGLAEERLGYVGVIFIGLMVTPGGPRVLEYNVRFGDPETQTLLPVLDADIAEVCEAMISGKIDRIEAGDPNRTAVGVVVAAEGYPGNYKKGLDIGLDPSRLRPGEQFVFQASTVPVGAGRVRSTGGRCLTVVGTGSDILAARASAYSAMAAVDFPGGRYRGDIGARFLVS